jgi:hypothetical protein
MLGLVGDSTTRVGYLKDPTKRVGSLKDLTARVGSLFLKNIKQIRLLRLGRLGWALVGSGCVGSLLVYMCTGDIFGINIS